MSFSLHPLTNPEVSGVAHVAGKELRVLWPAQGQIANVLGLANVQVFH